MVFICLSSASAPWGTTAMPFLLLVTMVSEMVLCRYEEFAEAVRVLEAGPDASPGARRQSSGGTPLGPSVRLVLVSRLYEWAAGCQMGSAVAYGH